ncbi:MAG: hypothetical protein ACKVT0_13685 [Planctomycetaceae bacterium]
MKRKLIALSLVSCAFLMMSSGSDAALFNFNGRFSDSFQRMKCKSRDFWNRMRNQDCCDNDNESTEEMTTEGEPTPAPIPAEEGTEAPVPTEAAPPSEEAPAEPAAEAPPEPNA